MHALKQFLNAWHSRILLDACSFLVSPLFSATFSVALLACLATLMNICMREIPAFADNVKRGAMSICVTYA